jgi:hypothetical protein
MQPVSAMVLDEISVQAAKAGSAVSSARPAPAMSLLNM